MKTELKDRILWFDGTSEVSPDEVPNLFLCGLNISDIAISSENEDTLQFNSLSDELLTNKKENKTIEKAWNIPQEYVSLDIEQFAIQKLKDKNIFNKKYIERLNTELHQIKKRDLSNLFKSLIYLVDKLKEKEIVWGVGRGSSCASLILFLIGLHLVDPVFFNISETEFFHD